MIMVIANVLTARSARPPGAGQIRRRQADGRLARPPGQAQPGSRRRRGGAGERDRPRRPSRARGVRTAVPPQRLRDTLFVRCEDGNTHGACVGDALMGKRSSAEGEAKSSASLMRLCLLAPRTERDGDGREGVNRHRRPLPAWSPTCPAVRNSKGCPGAPSDLCQGRPPPGLVEPRPAAGP